MARGEGRLLIRPLMARVERPLLLRIPRRPSLMKAVLIPMFSQEAQYEA
jgi:hypothetical protein